MRFDGGPARPNNGAVSDGNEPAPGRGQRQHILDTALSLMAQSGVDGTSMRDLAAARYDTLVNGLKLKAAAGTLTEEDVGTVNRLLGTD